MPTFKNLHDKTGLCTLLLQAFPDHWQSILRLFEDCKQHLYEYIIIKLQPAFNDQFDPMLGRISGAAGYGDTLVHALHGALDNLRTNEDIHNGDHVSGIQSFWQRL